MVETTPASETGSTTTAGWTLNSFGQRMYTKPRRFIVVRAGRRSCLCVPITTYGGRGVNKGGVKKSDHCIVYTGSKAPLPKQNELAIPPEQGMQSIPIRVDSDVRTVRLDEMSRIDFSKPVNVEHYNRVKNFGKVHPSSIQALESQFMNVIFPTRARRGTAPAGAPPVELESTRSRHWLAYSALLQSGWSPQQATAYVNSAIKGARIARPDGEESSSDSEDERRDDDDRQ